MKEGFSVGLPVQSVVGIFGKAVFPKIPTANCTCGPTAIAFALMEWNRCVFVAAAALYERVVTYVS